MTFPSLPPFAELTDEYTFYDPKSEDRTRFFIELGRKLEPMPPELKTDVTKVAGCVSSVWVYPVQTEFSQLHFFADSDSAITKGMIALVVSAVQDQSPAEIATINFDEILKPFDLQGQLTSKRTQGLPNMIALVRETAERLAA